MALGPEWMGCKCKHVQICHLLVCLDCTYILCIESCHWPACHNRPLGLVLGLTLLRKYILFLVTQYCNHGTIHKCSNHYIMFYFTHSLVPILCHGLYLGFESSKPMKFYHTLNIKMQNIFVFKKPPLTVRQTIVCFSRHFLNLGQNIFPKEGKSRLLVSAAHTGRLLCCEGGEREEEYICVVTCELM